MEQEIKKNEHKAKKDSTRIGAVIILIISALVFLPFGASAVFESIFAKRQVNVYGYYNGKKIAYEPGSKFFNATANLAKQVEQSGQKIDESMYGRIMREAFYQTAVNMAFTDAVKKSGYEVPKSAIDRMIVYRFTDPATGKFSQKLYNQVSNSDLEALREDAYGNLFYSRFATDLYGTSSYESFNGNSLYGLKKSNAEKRFLAKMGAEKHSFDAVAFTMENYPLEEAIKYGKNNAEKFIKYDFSIITVNDEAEAKAILKQIKSNEITFEDAASEKSQKFYSEPNGKAAGSYKFQVENILDDLNSITEIEKLSENEISSVIKTKRGYSIIRCDGPFVAADFNNNDVQQTVLNYIKNSEISYIENYFINIAENFISEVAISDFDNACKKFNIEKSEIQPFAINYGDSNIYPTALNTGVLAGLSSNAQAYEAAFALKVNEIGSPFVLNSKVVVLKCTDIQIDEVEDASEKEIDNANNNAIQAAFFADKKFEDNYFMTYLKLLQERKE